MKRSDRLAIHLEFDYDGACALLKLVQSTLSECAEIVPIEFDKGITKKKRFSETTTRNLTIIVGDDEIVESGDILTLKLESETIEYFKERLEECIQTKEFNPPELCELFVRGRDTENDVYCIMK